jgi:hypothetical protein
MLKRKIITGKLSACLDALRKDIGSEKLMQRSDVSTMFNDSSRALQTKN